MKDADGLDRVRRPDDRLPSRASPRLRSGSARLTDSTSAPFPAPTG